MTDTSTEHEPGVADRLRSRVARSRERWPVVDHAVLAVRHMTAVHGTILAGAVTYFGYLSFFPVLVIAFAIISVVAFVVPDAQEGLLRAVQYVFPGLIGTDDTSLVDVKDIKEFKTSISTVGVIAVLGLLYTGLGWMSAARAGLQAVFEVPNQQRRNFVLGKLTDLLVLGVIGAVLIVSVSLSGAVVALTENLFELLQFDEVPGPGMVVLLRVLALALSLAASTLLFFTMFAMLPTAELPRMALVKGAFVAALGFEVLKLVAGVLIGAVSANPATAVLGTSLVLLVWINYFSRVIMVGASWAYTSPEARLIRQRRAERQRSRAELAERRRRRRVRYGQKPRVEAVLAPAEQRRVDRLSVAAGAVTGLTAAVLANAVRRRQ